MNRVLRALLRNLNRLRGQTRDIWKVLTYHPWHRSLYICTGAFSIVVGALLEYPGDRHALKALLSHSWVATPIWTGSLILCAVHVVALFHTLNGNPFHPGKNVLNVLEEIDPGLCTFLRVLFEKPVKNRKDYWDRFVTVRSHLSRKFLRLQWALIVLWITNLLMIIVLASIAVVSLATHYDQRFVGLDLDNGFLPFMYFSLTTITTIGPGVIAIHGSIGELVVMALEMITLALLTVGSGFVVNAWYALPSRLRQDIDERLGGLP